jgi:hypothetical protein
MNPHPTVLAWLAKEAMGSETAASVATGALGAGAVALGIAGGSPFVAVIGVLLVVLAAAWTGRGISRARTARRMRAVHQPTE